MAYVIYSPGKWEVYEQIAVALIPEKKERAICGSI